MKFSGRLKLTVSLVTALLVGGCDKDNRGGEEPLARVTVPSSQWRSVTEFGAKGDGITDDTLAIQSALDAVKSSGETLFLPSGDYVVSSPLLYESTNPEVSEAGLRLIGTHAFKARFLSKVTNGPVLRLRHVVPYRFQSGTQLQNFSIRPMPGQPAPADNHGIEIANQQNLVMSNLYISNLTGDGIRIVSKLSSLAGNVNCLGASPNLACNSDGHGSANLTFENLSLRYLRRGITSVVPPEYDITRVNTFAYLSIRDSFIQFNQEAGVYFSGALTFDIVRNSFSANGTVMSRALGGLIFDGYSRVSNGIISQNEFDGNRGNHIKLKAYNVQVIQNMFTSQVYAQIGEYAPYLDIDLVGGMNYVVFQNRWDRRRSTTTRVPGTIDVKIGATVRNTSVDDSFCPDPGETHVLNLNPDWNVIEDSCH